MRKANTSYIVLGFLIALHVTMLLQFNVIKKLIKQNSCCQQEDGYENS